MSLSWPITSWCFRKYAIDDKLKNASFTTYKYRFMAYKGMINIAINLQFRRWNITDVLLVHKIPVFYNFWQ